MNMPLRQKVSTLLIDAPLYIYLLLSSKLFNNHAWMTIRNRKEKIKISSQPFGVKCLWLWSSDLRLPKILPFFGQMLLRHSLKAFKFKLSDAPTETEKKPELSFIIGHRGLDRFPLLIKTLKSIAAQQGCRIECIVVEQDQTPLIRELLPSWVKYVHTKPAKPGDGFSRAWAFNVGAELASSDCLIFHDNDLLITSDYAKETLKLTAQGYDFVNLKRFIFYLNKDATQQTIDDNCVSKNLSVESIMQNAEGGGSIGCSRSAYFDIGGFDERFVGWGGEDNEFWQRACTLNVWVYGNRPLIHLWHAPQSEKQKNLDSQTHQLYQDLSNKPLAERIKWLKQNQTLNARNNYVRN